MASNPPAKPATAAKRKPGRPKKSATKPTAENSVPIGTVYPQGHVPALAPELGKSPQSAGEKSAPRRKYKQSHKGTRLARDRASIIKRQRADCKRLADAIKEAAGLSDKGAGSSGLAAAVGQLARATATLHDLEASSYGLQDTNRAVIAVIHVPARAETIEDWAAGQRTVLQQVAGQSMDLDHLNASARHTVEDDIIGAPADDDDDAAGPQDYADDEDQP